MAATTASATTDGSSIATFSSSFIATTLCSFMLVRVARGAMYITLTRVSASSRRSASEKPRRANLLAQ
ncbi:hypothetical protein D3C81_1833060 [compost metagenome]